MPSRTRTRGGLSAMPNVSTCDVLKSGATGTCTAHVSQYNSGKYEVMTDVVTKSFSKKRNSGELINSPMTRTVITASAAELYETQWIWVLRPENGTWPPSQVVGFKSPDPIGLRFGRLTFPESQLPSWDGTKAGLALASARSQASAPQSQLLVTLGESRETFRMLQGALNLALKRTEPFKKLRRRYERGELTYRDFLQEFANLDLLIRYGVLPLVYDIEGYVKALSEPTKPERRTARAAHRDSGNTHWVQTGSSSMINKIEINHDLAWTREYRATTLFESVDDLQARIGLRLADVPSALWELTRLSFVADWFVNTGEFLGSLTLAGRANVLLQCVVERLTAQYTAVYTESGTVKSSTSDTVCISDGSGSKVSMVATRTTRQPFAANDPGSYSARVKLTPQRIVDGFSLLATNLDISNRRSRIVRI